MTQLLVSVRDVSEAAAALRGGAQVIDIKEPRRGPLGAADPSVWCAIAEHVAGRAQVSAALGELLEPRAPQWLAALPHLAFVKLGLAGCARCSDWPARWEQHLAGLPAGTTPVAVIYADHRRAAAPPPAHVVQHARRLACRGLLVDTFSKSSGWLLDFWDNELADAVSTARRSGLFVALAGRITCARLKAVMTLDPDLVAVRGAACRHDRDSRISAARVRRIHARLSSFAGSAARFGDPQTIPGSFA